jgi:DNA modification methylase
LASDVFYSDACVEIRRGDCREILPALAASGLRADIVLADPPYAISRDETIRRGGRLSGGDLNLKFGDWDVFAGEEDFWRFTAEWARAADACLKPGGAFACWFDKDKISILSLFLRREFGYRSRGYLAWIKTNPAPKVRRGAGWMSAWEMCGIWEKPGGNPYQADAPQAPDWFASPSNADGPRLHRCQKPLALAELILAHWCPLGGLALDPFLGSGTAALAAKRTGRRCVGIEIDLQCCLTAARRCAQEVLPVAPAAPAPRPEQAALFAAGRRRR